MFQDVRAAATILLSPQAEEHCWCMGVGILEVVYAEPDGSDARFGRRAETPSFVFFGCDEKRRIRVFQFPFSQSHVT